jgi:hypothetical protein
MYPNWDFLIYHRATKKLHFPAEKWPNLPKIMATTLTPDNPKDPLFQDLPADLASGEIFGSFVGDKGSTL